MPGLTKTEHVFGWALIEMRIICRCGDKPEIVTKAFPVFALCKCGLLIFVNPKKPLDPFVAIKPLDLLKMAGVLN